MSSVQKSKLCIAKCKRCTLESVLANKEYTDNFNFKNAWNNNADFAYVYENRDTII